MTSLPLGLFSFPKIFQKPITKLPVVIIYVESAMNDIIIQGQISSELCSTTEMSRSVCQKQMLSYISMKWKIQFLAHIITSNGVEVDPEKMKATIN